MGKKTIQTKRRSWDLICVGYVLQKKERFLFKLLILSLILAYGFLIV